MRLLEEKARNRTNKPLSLRCLLEELFSRLDNNGVLYCVLRNYEGLPERVGNDIDLLVDQRDLKAFRQCILTAAGNTGWVLFKNPMRYAFQSFWLKNISEYKFVQIDVWSILHYRSVPLADTKWILNSRMRNKQFFIPQPGIEAGILLMKDAIHTGQIKPKYLDKICKMIEKDPNGFRDFLMWPLGVNVATWLFEKAQEKAWQAIEKKRIQLCMAAICRAFCRNPLGLLLNFVRFLWGHLWARLAKPVGVFVVLLGPDGSGKSAVAERLQETLKPAFRHRQYYHGRFGILPRLKFFKDCVFKMIGRPVQVHSDEIEQHHNGAEHSSGRVLVHVLYYSLDYLFGHWVVRKSQAAGNLIIFDRYFYDWFIQSYFERTPIWILPILKFIYPRPDLVVYLSNSAGVIHQRKPELTVEQIEKQNQRCREIVWDLPCAVTITTESSLQEVTQQVSEKVAQIMVERYKGRSFCL